jgi:hypothetical protein
MPDRGRESRAGEIMNYELRIEEQSKSKLTWKGRMDWMDIIISLLGT